MSSGASGRMPEARELFGELADLPLAEAQARLSALEGSDAELAALVRGLLEADQRAGSFLEEGAAAWSPGAIAELAAQAEPETSEPPGLQIGPYRIVSLLGRGGMGEVYLAERTDGQFERKVALKLLTRGGDSAGIRLRFLRERQLLARLDHPNIARLLDGGTVDGRPFFVLELVEGEPITLFCRKRSLPLEKRIRLMQTCCEAVETAHRRLVVHRDLKPSNILVTAEGTVKLLDFGIAKVLSGEEEETQLTRTGESVLTPAYAAPEQILGEPVTTATDVYSLGVVFYEMLTGALPHGRKTSSPEKLVSQVEKETVERPSRAIERASRETLQAAGVQERDRSRLSARLAGDLDSVLLKALRREPERRYASAAALGEDLHRHLGGLPVQARPDTLGYRAGKFVRRHRAGVAAAALVFLALLAGLAAALWQADVARGEARRAEAQARRAERVKAMLLSVFQHSDPSESLGEKRRGRSSRPPPPESTPSSRRSPRSAPSSTTRWRASIMAWAPSIGLALWLSVRSKSAGDWLGRPRRRRRPPPKTPPRCVATSGRAWLRWPRLSSARGISMEPSLAPAKRRDSSAKKERNPRGIAFGSR